MNLTILFSRWMSKRLDRKARLQRRALRDYYRFETARIDDLETRSRGLRLYAAWITKENSNVIHSHAADWHRVELPPPAYAIDIKTDAAA